VSGLLAGKVWQSDLPRDLKPLAAVLADRADDDGNNLFPSVAYLRWALSDSDSPPVSKRSVQAKRSALRNLGLLREVAAGEGGRGNFTRYRFVAEKLPGREPWNVARKREPWAGSRAERVQQAALFPEAEDEGVRLPASKRCNPARERVKPIAPYPSVPVRGEPSGENRHRTAPCKTGTSPVDDPVLALFELLKKTTAGLTDEHLRFAVERIRARARTEILKPVVYFREALPRFIQRFNVEVEWFLRDVALDALRAGLDNDEAIEAVKNAAARYGLSYSSESALAAVDRAARILERQRGTESELRVGGREKSWG
jgi:hypothetical protein